MSDTTLADDLLHGIKEIAAYCGLTYRACQWHIERGRFPVVRIGKIICARKSDLDALYRPNTGRAA